MYKLVDFLMLHRPRNLKLFVCMCILMLLEMHVCGGGCLWVAHACGIVISRASTPAEAVGEGAAAMSGVGVRRGGEWRHRWLKAKSEYYYCIYSFWRGICF